MKKILHFIFLLFFCCTFTKGFGQATTLAGGNTSTANIGPSITYSTPAASAPVASFTLAQTGSGANLTQVSFTTLGTYSASTDITSFALYVNTVANSFNGSTAVPTATVTATSAGLQTISLTTAYALGTTALKYYFFVVPTFAASPVAGHTISVASILSTNITVSTGTVTGSAAATGTLTIFQLPTVTGTTPGSRCGTGTVTLNATPSTGASINWYAASTGGTSLSTGNTYTTPSISVTTPYYAEASQPAIIQTGTLADNTTALAGPYYMDQRTDLHWFSSVNACTINSVDVYPYQAETIVITMTDPTGVILATATPYVVTAGQASNTIPVTIPLGFSVPAGATNYRLGGDGTFTLTQAIYRGASSSTYGPYPTTVDGFAQVGDAGGDAFATGVSGAFAGYGARCYFYNWNVSLAAASTPRSTVTATVNPLPTPTFTASPGANLCVGSSTTYTTQAAQSAYAWTIPGVAGTDYNITSGGIGSSSNTVTLTWLTTGSKTVTVNYSNGTCTGATAASATTTINALPVPSFTASPTAGTCSNTGVTYTTQSAQTGYTWTVPGVSGTDYSVTSGGTGSSSNTVTLNWLTTGAKTVTVNYANAAGCTGTTAASSATTVNATPVPTFTGTVTPSVCQGNNITYTTQSGQSAYSWGVPGVVGTDYTVAAGGTSSTDNTVTVTWLTTGNKTITVNYTTGSCPGLTPASVVTTVNITPVVTYTMSPGANTCVGSIVTYATQSGRTAYLWTVPGTAGTDYTITAGGTGSTNNTVTLNWLTTGTKNVVIYYNSALGCPAVAPVTSTTNVEALPVPTFTSSPGANTCANSSVTYTTQSGFTSYTWTIPGTSGTNYVITSGSTSSNTVTLTWLTTGVKTVTVNYSNADGCTGASPASTTTTVNPQPSPTFTSAPGANTCANSSVTYTTQSGQSSYSWAVPGVSGTDYTTTSGGIGTGSNTVTLTWLTTGSKTVSVNYTTLSGCTGATAITNTTTVNAQPVPTFTTSLPTDICSGNSATYTTQAGQTAYTWAVPGVAGTDYTITSGGIGSGSNTVTLTWLSTGSKTVTVNYTNASGCVGAAAASSSTTVDVAPTPTFTASPSGSLCANTSVTYTTQAGQTSYVWTVPGTSGVDYTITSGGTGSADNTVTLSWLSSGSKTVAVNYSNSIGCPGSVAASNTITINALPVPTFTAAPGSDLCANSSATYTTQSGQTAYTWSVTGVAGIDYALTSGGIAGTDNTVTLTWLTANAVTVTVNYTDLNGCIGAAAAANSININPLPALVGGPTQVCEASSITLTDATSGGSWSAGNTAVANIDMVSGMLSGIIAGTSSVTYSLSTGCSSSTTVTVNPLPGDILGANSVCVGSTTNLTDGGGGTWHSSDGSVATIGLHTGTVGGVTSGTPTITYTLPTGCLTTTPFNVNPLPSAITGVTNVCTGATTGLSDPDGGGTWSSSNTFYATVDLNLGTVNGANAGTINITYTLPTTCKIATSFTVNLTPAPISGSNNVCVGSLITVGDVNGGGTWATSDAGLASITGTTVSGVASGNPTITYTLPAGCYTTKNLTVNPLPSAIEGITHVCIGSASALSDPDGGGSWSSGNTFTATVVSGAVTGVHAGAVNITYTLPTGCATNTSFTVNAIPQAITGANAVCSGGSTLFSDLTTGGSWTATAGSGVVSVDASGMVTGIVPGTATITYTRLECPVSKSILVNSLPTPVTGIMSLCATTTTSLLDATTGGTWSSSNTALASVNPVSGVVSGLSAGSPTITYKLSTNCYITSTITVNPLPAVYSVIGGGSYCAGTGGLHVGISGSQTGVNYQLFYGVTHVGSPIPGTGDPLDFGAQTLSEIYTVVANDGATSCTANMAGSAPVILNALPSVYNVTGGGHRCSTGPGVHIGLDGANSGISYQIYNGSVPVGAAIAGIGSASLDLGTETAAATYTVIATNVATTCSVNMASSATVVIDPTVVPAVTLSTGVGDVICAGNLVHVTAVTANGGATPTYSWTRNGLGASVIGGTYTFLPADGDIITVALTSSAACVSPVSVMSLPLTLSVIPYGTPSVHITAVPGDTVCQGTLVHYSATTAFGGTTPTITWVANSSTIIGSGSLLLYTPSNHDVISSILSSDYFCRTADSGTSNNITMQVTASIAPTILVNATPSATISKGESVTVTTNVTGAGPTPYYQWYLNGAPVAAAIGATFTSTTFADGDSIYCVVTSSGVCNGLTSSAGAKIHITRVGVQQVLAAGSDIRLAPNPNQGIFTVKGSLGTTADQDVTLVVTDMLGQVVYNASITVTAGRIDHQITLNNVANGMYLLNIRSGNENSVFHFVIGK